MVLYIQSNYINFGLGIVILRIGIVLYSRGNNFNLDFKYYNVVKLFKKFYYIIIFGFLGKEDKVIGLFGVMGVFM